MHQTAEVLTLSFEEFLEWEHRQPQRHEFLAGEVVAMTGTTDRHNTVSLNLAFALREGLRGSPCRVFMADVMVRVEADDMGFYPDVMVTCSEADRADPYVKREPLVVMEVLSETTAAYDIGEKFSAYRQLPSLREYVLVDPERPRAEVFRRQADGRWLVDTLGLSDRLELASLGLEIPMSEVYLDCEFAAETRDQGRPANSNPGSSGR